MNNLTPEEERARKERWNYGDIKAACNRWLEKRGLQFPDDDWHRYGKYRMGGLKRMNCELRRKG